MLQAKLIELEGKKKKNQLSCLPDNNKGGAEVAFVQSHGKELQSYRFSKGRWCV